MDISQMLAQLRAERDQIEAAIVALEHLARGSGRRRGRPPKLISDESVDSEPGARAKKKPRKFSAEARKRMAEAQRKRWAARQEQQEQQ
jgi:hypothetical protein